MKPTTLGILGGGQLGRMSALAAARLGIETVIFTPHKDDPATFVTHRSIIADYGDRAALKKFAKLVDVISYEFENIPIETVRYLQKLKPVYPDDRLLEIAQDRIREKTYLNKIGIRTAPWAVADRKSLDKIFIKLGKDGCIIKTARFGYDGKGQVLCRSLSELTAACKQLTSGDKNNPLIVEKRVDFECELSVIAARDRFGSIAVYGPMRNEHRHHILHQTTVPAGVAPAIERKAINMARRLARAVDLRGVLALELFLTREGDLLANEIAPRTHNSGHWTIDACAASQFENHVRAVCGLPLAPPARHSDAVMINLIGKDVENIDRYLKKPCACVHLYGKKTAKPGRKMGHVTFLSK